MFKVRRLTEEKCGDIRFLIGGLGIGTLHSCTMFKFSAINRYDLFKRPFLYCRGDLWGGVVFLGGILTFLGAV